MMGAWNTSISDWAARAAASTGMAVNISAVANQPSTGTPAEYYGSGQKTDIDAYKTVYVAVHSVWHGYYSDDSLNPGPYFSSNQNARDVSSAKRLEFFKWIPYNPLEVSKTVTMQSKVGAFGRSNKWDYYGGYYEVIWPSNKSGDNPLADYFATLRATTNIEDYLRLLAWYDLSGVSASEIYVDDMQPELSSGPGAYRYRGFPSVNPLYADFWKYYATAVAEVSGVIQNTILSAAQLTQKVSQQFDLNTLEQYLTYIQGTLANGFSRNLNAPADPKNLSGVSYINGLLNQKFSVEVKTYGIYHHNRQPVMVNDPISYVLNPNLEPIDSPAIKSWGTDVGPDAWVKRSVMDIPLLINDQPVYKLISAIWDSNIKPLLAQIDWLAVQIARLRESPSTFTEQEAALLNDITNNMFLALDLESTKSLKTLIAKQLAKAPLISTQPTKVQLPGLSYKYQAALKVNEIKAEFAPHWTLSIDPAKLPKQNTGKGSGSIIPLLLAAAGVAAVAYYSNK